jgi:hypothetical protein
VLVPEACWDLFGTALGPGLPCAPNPCLTSATPGALRAVAALRLAPNPFERSVTIEADLPREGSVRLEVLDPAGRLVRVLTLSPRSAGSCLLRWDGRDGSGQAVPGGAYFFRMTGAGGTATGRAMLLR